MESWTLSDSSKSLEGHGETEAQRWGATRPGCGDLGRHPRRPHSLAKALSGDPGMCLPVNELQTSPSPSLRKIMITLPVRVEKPRSSPSVRLHFQLLLHLGTLGELSQRAEQDLDRVWPVVIPLELYFGPV